MSWKTWLASLRRKQPPRYWALVDPYWDAVSIYDGPEVFLAGFSAVPTPSKHLLATHWLQSEVHNGGFSQFFSNSTGVLAPEAVAGFRAIGMPRSADLVEEAMAWLGPSYPRDRDERNDALDAFEEAHGVDHGPECDVCSADSRFWDLMANEAGGFDAAADFFAQQHSRPTQ
ncbi:DMP19 family protein [Caulobacter vibrioides]|uniref:DMP19 family protein n=1 Tax=Caulobacter vibrioides TaxID=155892 RepID=UPI0013DE64DB|nr:DMP19 family protein [Caulobacter vibrioides]